MIHNFVVDDNMDLQNDCNTSTMLELLSASTPQLDRYMPETPVTSSSTLVLEYKNNCNLPITNYSTMNKPTTSSTLTSAFKCNSHI